MDNWNNSPPCESCEKPGERPGPLEPLAYKNQKAYQVWLWCNSYGRSEMTGRLKIEAVTSSLAAIGGTIQDVSKVTDIIEPIFKELNDVKQQSQG